MKRILSFLLTLAFLFTALPAGAQQSWQLAGFLYRSAIAFGVPSSGSFSTNGALTLNTALPAAYADAYFYFPAGAICASSTAGLYYTVMSSTTAGTVYDNTYTSGLPTIPSSPTTYTCSTAPGAYTQSTSAQTLITQQLAGGFLSINGAIQFSEIWDFAGTAQDKTFVTALGGTTLFSELETTNNHNTSSAVITTENRGNVARQMTDGSVFGASANAITRTTVNTASNQNLTVAAQLASASDFAILEAMQILAYP